MKTSEILTKAKELIVNPNNWITDEFHKKHPEYGDCFCAIGAIAQVVQQEGQGVYFLAAVGSEPEMILREVVGLIGGVGYTFAKYNDEHLHEEVMVAFDKAIYFSQRKENSKD